MSRVEGFNDNVTDITATQPFMAPARPSREATDPAETEHHPTTVRGQTAQSPAPGTNRKDTPWPSWPRAWPDDSLPSRSGGAGH